MQISKRFPFRETIQNKADFDFKMVMASYCHNFNLLRFTSEM